MSRMGKKPVTIVDGVDVTINGRSVVFKGKLGEMTLDTTDHVTAKIEDGTVVVSPTSKSKHALSMWGTMRSHVVNYMKGVSEGFKINLEINGVGYRAAVQGKEIVMQLGFSHEVRYTIPEGVKVTCEKPTLMQLEGVDRQQLGQMAANIRKYRPPEPYKGKGIKYAGEYILRKEGKKK